MPFSLKLASFRMCCQKKKFVARNIFLAILKKYTLTKFSPGYLTNLWPVLGQISNSVKFMSLKKIRILQLNFFYFFVILKKCEL